MGEKDVTEKTLEAYGDVFADIINVLMFGGEQVVSPDDLEDATPVSMYKVEGKIHEQERDVAKYWKQMTLRLALLGMENQTDYDADMPLRLFGYDGTAYRAQILTSKELNTDKDAPKEQRTRYPVFTLVLYFGSEHWTKNRRLEERVAFPEGLKERLLPFFNDYRANVFEIAYLTEEQVKLFQSDFRVVAEYFVRSRTDPDYQPEPTEIRHVDAMLKLLSVMTGDRRFEEILTMPGGGKPKMMSEVLNRAEQRGMERGMECGMERGMERGIERGIAQNKVEVARRMLAANMTYEQVAEFTTLPIEEVRILRQ